MKWNEIKLCSIYNAARVRPYIDRIYTWQLRLWVKTYFFSSKNTADWRKTFYKNWIDGTHFKLRDEKRPDKKNLPGQQDTKLK